MGLMLCLALHGFAQPSYAVSYTFEPLDFPALYVSARAFNDHGDIVGVYADPGDFSNRGFLYSNGVFINIDVPGAQSTLPEGINNAGHIVGSYSDGTEHHGFIFANDVFTTIEGPGGHNTILRGINNAGQIVGSYLNPFSVQGFVYSNGSFENIDFPGALYTIGYGINDKAEIVGSYADDSDRDHAYLLSEGIYTPINLPEGVITNGASGINNRGEILGHYQDLIDGKGRSFVLAGNSFTTITYPDALNYGISAINNKGQLLGAYWDSNPATDPPHHFIAIPIKAVPEPSALLLLSSGLVCILFVRSIRLLS
jgi:uncharacterized membrane protein